MEVIWAMKPWASANENSTRKPFRPVVAVGSAAIRRSVIVTVGAVGRRSNADADADLRPYFGSGRCEANPSHNYERKILQPNHIFSSVSRAVIISAASRYREVTLTVGVHNTGFLVCPIGAGVAACECNHRVRLVSAELLGLDKSQFTRVRGADVVGQSSEQSLPFDHFSQSGHHRLRRFLLHQLRVSNGPSVFRKRTTSLKAGESGLWCARRDSNTRPCASEAHALSI